MPLNIKDDQTHQVARRLAEQKGVSMAKAVRDALAEALRVAEHDTKVLNADLDRIAISLAAKEPGDHRTADEIIGYDEQGLPA